MGVHVPPGVHFDISSGTLQPEFSCLNCRGDALTPYCRDSGTKSHSNCGEDLFFGLQSNSGQNLIQIAKKAFFWSSIEVLG